MKLLLVAQGLHPYSGGSAVSEASLCAQMSKRCETLILCRQGAIDYSFARSYGLKDIREYYPSEIYAAWRDKNHWLNRLMDGVDLCHLNGHWRWEDYFLARLCVRRRIPYVLQPRGMLLVGHRSVWLKRVYNQMLGKWIVRHAGQVIALSRFEVRQYSPYGLHESRISVVPNGINRVSPPDFQSLPRELRELVEGRPYYLYFGRLEKRKNLIFLVDVFASYLSGGGDADLYLMGPSERGYDELLGKRIEALGVGARVRVMRPSYDAERWCLVGGARAVVYPTLEEPFGRVPFEAISAGTLPIVPDESGSAEYLKDLVPAGIYRHQKPESLLETFVRFDEMSAETREKLLSTARSWVHSRLDWTHVGDELFEVYRRASGQSGAGRARVL